jgi:hypothetical protein
MKPVLFLLFTTVWLQAGCADAPVGLESQRLTDAADLDLDNHTMGSAATIERTEYGVFGYPFQIAGPPGDEGVLEEGSTWPPTKGSHAKLLRGEDFVQLNAHTTGLPPGAYTVWWGFINKPEMCAVPGACTPVDIFNPITDGSVFWATGGLVQENGVGNFNARVYAGTLPQGEDQILLAGNGLTNVQGAVVFSVIKYHGPASDDPAELYAQTHTAHALCGPQSNAYTETECFDPQMAVFQ